MEPIDYFRAGFDTMQIARVTGRTEAAVLRSITVARSIEFDEPVVFMTRRGTVDLKYAALGGVDIGARWRPAAKRSPA